MTPVVLKGLNICQDSLDGLSANHSACAYTVPKTWQYNHVSMWKLKVFELSKSVRTSDYSVAGINNKDLLYINFSMSVSHDTDPTRRLR